MKNFSLILFLAFIFIAPCFAGDPDWVEIGKSAKYPDSGYIVGIGISQKDQKGAEDNARAEIAKVFNTKIESISKDVMESSKVYEKKKIKVDSQESFVQVTKTSTQKVLEGTEIKENFKKKDSFYALAILDKQKFSQILTSRIMEIDTGVKKLMDDLETAVSKIDKIRNYKQTIDKLIERKTYDEELKIVSPAGLGIDSEYNLTQVSAAFAKLLSEDFTVKIDFNGDAEREIRAALSETINKLGFRVIKTGSPDITVEAKVQIEDFNHPNKEWKWVKYEASFELNDVKTEKVFGTSTLSGKKPHLTAEGARSKAVSQIKTDITSEVSLKIRDYIF